MARGGGVHHRPGRLQAHAGLLERRAHGHPRRWASGWAAGAALGAMLHAVNHSLTKAMLFLLAGNILAAYRTKSIRATCAACCGPCRSPARSGWSGSSRSPARRRSALFVSELTILKGALQQGQTVVCRRLSAAAGASSSSAWPASSCGMVYGSPAGIAVRSPSASRGAWAAAAAHGAGSRGAGARGSACRDWLQSALTAAAAAAGGTVMPNAPPGPQRPTGPPGGCPLLPLDAFAEVLAGDRRGRRPGWPRCSAARRPVGGMRLLAVLADPDEGRPAAARLPRWRRPTPPHPRLPAGALVRARNRRAVGLAPGRPPVAEAHPLPAPRPRRRPGRLRSGVTDFFGMEGEEVHEVAVGPVHAGVIEPGHFRFQCHGEDVLSPGDLARLPAPRASSARSPAGRTGARVHYVGDAGRRHHDRTRLRLLPGRGGARGPPRAGPGHGAARDRRSSWSGWPTTSATWARWPATSASCRRCATAAGSAATS